VENEKANGEGKEMTRKKISQLEQVFNDFIEAGVQNG
jgi:hypothetical protein